MAKNEQKVAKLTNRLPEPIFEGVGRSTKCLTTVFSGGLSLSFSSKNVLQAVFQADTNPMPKTGGFARP